MELRLERTGRDKDRRGEETHLEQDAPGCKAESCRQRQTANGWKGNSETGYRIALHVGRVPVTVSTFRCSMGGVYGALRQVVKQAQERHSRHETGAENDKKGRVSAYG